jgi:isoleucyl-tRNA synthetase
LNAIPTELVAIAKCTKVDPSMNNQGSDLKNIQLEKEMRTHIHSITTKELQQTLKRVMNKLESLNVTVKLNINQFDVENILQTRHNCKNAKLRNIYFRMINGDFYSNARMKKFKMIETLSNEESLKNLQINLK